MDQKSPIGLRPVDGYMITRAFGVGDIKHYKGGFHKGTDWGCPKGTPVKAYNAGKVTTIGGGPDGWGTYLVLAHDGYFTIYAHLLETFCNPKDLIKQGQVIALSGNSGNVFSSHGGDGAHLHHEGRWPDKWGTHGSGQPFELTYYDETAPIKV